MLRLLSRVEDARRPSSALQAPWIAWVQVEGSHSLFTEELKRHLKWRPPLALSTHNPMLTIACEDGGCKQIRQACAKGPTKNTSC